MNSLDRPFQKICAVQEAGEVELLPSPKKIVACTKPVRAAATFGGD
jgi:hypothetical protein